MRGRWGPRLVAISPRVADVCSTAGPSVSALPAGPSPSPLGSSPLLHVKRGRGLRRRGEPDSVRDPFSPPHEEAPRDGCRRGAIRVHPPECLPAGDAAGVGAAPPSREASKTWTCLPPLEKVRRTALARVFAPKALVSAPQVVFFWLVRARVQVVPSADTSTL